MISSTNKALLQFQVFLPTLDALHADQVAAMIQQRFKPRMVAAERLSTPDTILFADALFWTRADGDVQLSTFFGLNDFNFVGGARVTLGYRENATQGRELTYFGTGQLDESETLTSAGGLQPIFGTVGGLSVPTGFLNANLHTQTKESQLHSLEYNRIKWGWDLLKNIYRCSLHLL